jgi:hypothetical protein
VFRGQDNRKHVFVIFCDLPFFVKTVAPNNPQPFDTCPDIHDAARIGVAMLGPEKDRPVVRCQHARNIDHRRCSAF